MKMRNHSPHKTDHRAPFTHHCCRVYAHLLRYPPLRQLFLRADGTIDEPYLKLRMRHLSNFWLRSAEGVFDDEYARYVDYVGRAHTSHGADPNIPYRRTLRHRASRYDAKRHQRCSQSRLACGR